MAEPLRVVVGAGRQRYPGWVHTQRGELDLLKPEDWRMRFGDAKVQAILAEHVWEHLSEEEAAQAARVLYEVLSPGGYVRCAVPDGFFPDEDYQRLVRAGGPGPADHPAASHKVVYTYQTLAEVFASAGFEVHLLEFCDEHGVFHFEDWDPEGGMVMRSRRFDPRNLHAGQGGLKMVSLIIDAVKPER